MVAIDKNYYTFGMDLLQPAGTLQVQNSGARLTVKWLFLKSFNSHQ